MDYTKLSKVLKYTINPRDILALRKARLEAILNSPVKGFPDMTSPQDVSNAGVRKWTLNSFSPTHQTAKPSHVKLTDNEKQAWKDTLSRHGPIQDADVGHFHNLSALVAGRIPATAISKAFLEHSVGKDLLSKAIGQGHTYFHVENPLGNQTIIGRPENLSYIKEGLAEGQEHKVLRGLGWPESRIPKPKLPLADEIKEGK